VATKLLRERQPEAEVILQLGSMANAILTIVRFFPKIDGTLSGLRDSVQVFAMIAGYIYESSKFLEDRRDTLPWRLVERGIQAGRPIPQLTYEELRQLFAWQSPFIKKCELLRNEYAFHPINPKRLRRWLLDSQRGENLVLETMENPDRTGWLFDASAQAFYDSTAGLDDSFSADIMLAMKALPFMVEAMVAGFVAVEPSGSLRVETIDTAEFGKGPWIMVLHTLGKDAEPFTIAVEMRPREANWSPFVVATPVAGDIQPVLRLGLIGPPLTPERRGEWWVAVSPMAATPQQSYFLFCAQLPEAVVFGPDGGELVRNLLTKTWGPTKHDLPPLPPGF
jgi:hypothetical protein